MTPLRLARSWLGISVIFETFNDDTSRRRDSRRSADSAHSFWSCFTTIYLGIILRICIYEIHAWCRWVSENCEAANERANLVFPTRLLSPVLWDFHLGRYHFEAEYLDPVSEKIYLRLTKCDLQFESHIELLSDVTLEIERRAAIHIRKTKPKGSGHYALLWVISFHLYFDLCSHSRPSLLQLAQVGSSLPHFTLRLCNAWSTFGFPLTLKNHLPGKFYSHSMKSVIVTSSSHDSWRVSSLPAVWG